MFSLVQRDALLRYDTHPFLWIRLKLNWTLPSANVSKVKRRTKSRFAGDECSDLMTYGSLCRLILQTLLPVRLIRGVLPSKALLNQYPKTRQVYGDIASAMKLGNVKAFNEALVKSEATLIRQGTYFAVEKAQSIAMRQLFRKV